MSGLILRGDTLRNFGLRLPVPYIERIQIEDATDEDIRAFIAPIDSSESESDFADLYSAVLSAGSGTPSKITTTISLMFNTSDDFLLDEFKTELIEDYYINYFIVNDSENIASLKKSKKNIKSVVNDLAWIRTDAWSWSANSISIPLKDFEDSFVITEDRDHDYNRIIKLSGISSDFVRPRVEDVDELYIFAAITMGSIHDFEGYSPIVYAMNFSDLAYEQIVRNGSVAIHSDDGFFDSNNNFYSGDVLMGLNSRYHSTDEFGPVDIIAGIQQVMNTYQQYRNRNRKIDSALTDIDFILAKYEEDPKLLVQLNKYGTMFPNAGAGSRIGRLYKNFKIAVNNANTALINQPILSKKLVRNAKIQDNRILVTDFDGDASIYRDTYTDEDLFYPIALQTKVAKYEQVDPNTSESGAEVPYTPEAAYTHLQEQIATRLKEIPTWSGDTLSAQLADKLEDGLGGAAEYMLGRIKSFLDWIFSRDRPGTFHTGGAKTWDPYAAIYEDLDPYDITYEDNSIVKSARALLGTMDHEESVLYTTHNTALPSTIEKCTLEVGLVYPNGTLDSEEPAYRYFAPIKKYSQLAPVSHIGFNIGGGVESSDDGGTTWTTEDDTSTSLPGLGMIPVRAQDGWPLILVEASSVAEALLLSEDVQNQYRSLKFQSFDILNSAFDPSSAATARMHSFMNKFGLSTTTLESENIMSNWIAAVFHAVLVPIIGVHGLDDADVQKGFIWNALNDVEVWERINSNFDLTDPATGEINEDNLETMIKTWLGIGTDDGSIGRQIKDYIDDLWESAFGDYNSSGDLAIRLCPDNNSIDTWNNGDWPYPKYGGNYPDMYEELERRPWKTTGEKCNLSNHNCAGTTWGNLDYTSSDGWLEGPGRGSYNIKGVIKNAAAQVYREQFKGPIMAAIREIIPWIAAYHGVSLGEGRHRKLANVNIWVQRYGWLFFDMEKYVLYQSEISKYLDVARLEKFLPYGRDMLNDMITFEQMALRIQPVTDVLRKSLGEFGTEARFDAIIKNNATADWGPFNIEYASAEGNEEYSPLAVKTLDVSSWRDFRVNTDGDLLVDGESPTHTRLFSHIIPRNLDFPQEETVPDNYRLMAFNYNSFIEDDLAIHYQDEIWSRIQIKDNSAKIIEYMHNKLLNEEARLLEYVELARENCAFNNIDAEFNTFFKEAMMDRYDPPHTAPWITAPAMFTAFTELYSGLYDGDQFTVLDEARKIMDSINPETGWLEGLMTFNDNFLALLGEYDALLLRAAGETGGWTGPFETQFRNFTMSLNKEKGNIIDYHVDSEEFDLPGDDAGSEPWRGGLDDDGTPTPGTGGIVDTLPRFETATLSDDIVGLRGVSYDDSATDYGFVLVDSPGMYAPFSVPDWSSYELDTSWWWEY